MDIHETFSRASAQFERTIARLDATGWDRVTVCEVPVRELVQHVASGNRFAVRLLAGASADDATAGLEYAAGEHALEAEVAASCAAQTEAFVQADRTRRLHHPAGDIDYDTFVRYRLGDLVVHAWDIAKAAGWDLSFDQDVVHELWRRVEPHIDEMRTMGAYGSGSRGVLPPDVSDVARVLDAFGRIE